MYEYLEGIVAERAPGRLVLDVGGVGYDLLVPLSASFPPSGKLRVWTHLVVRDDGHVLYGFPDRSAREIFRLLLCVRGVGPVMALGVMSGLAPRALLDAIVRQDLAPLTRIRGVGKRTGEQILLDLREKAAEIAAAHGGAEIVPQPRAAAEKNIVDAVHALVSVGYSEKEAKKQVEGAARRVDPLQLEELVRAALQA